MCSLIANWNMTNRSKNECFTKESATTNERKEKTHLWRLLGSNPVPHPLALHPPMKGLHLSSALLISPSGVAVCCEHKVRVLRRPGGRRAGKGGGGTRLLHAADVRYT